MHYECELAVVIGRTAKKVKRADAMGCVAGYTVANDYAVRDYLENWYRPNLRVKNRDGATAIGPWLVDAADVPDPHARAAHARQRGRHAARQHARHDPRHPGADRVPEQLHDARRRRRDPHRHARRRRQRERGRRGRDRDRRHRAPRSTPSSATKSSAAEARSHHAHPASDRRPPGRERRPFRETVDPATQTVLAEVASGGAAEVDAAVAAAKARSPGRRSCGRERARLMHRLGDLIAQHVPDLSETETRDTGQVIGQTRRQLVRARGRQLPLLRRDVRARRRPHLPTADAPELHAVPPGRRVRADLAVERAVHDGDLEGRAVPGLRQHRRC